MKEGPRLVATLRTSYKFSSNFARPFEISGYYWNVHEVLSINSSIANFNFKWLITPFASLHMSLLHEFGPSFHKIGVC
jgi:hypothetical protein